MKLLLINTPYTAGTEDGTAPHPEPIDIQQAGSLTEALAALRAGLFDFVIADAASLADPTVRLRETIDATQGPACHLIFAVERDGEFPVEAIHDGTDGWVAVPLSDQTLREWVEAYRQLDVDIMQRRADLRRRDEEIATLVAISNLITSNLEFTPLLAAISMETSKVLDADRTTIFLYHAEDHELEAAFAEGLGSNAIRMPIDLGIAGHVATTRQMMNVEEAYRELWFHRTIDEQTGYRTHSVLCAPLISPTGTIVGVAECLNKRHGLFTPADEHILAMLSPLFAVAIENAQLYGDLQEEVRQNERMTTEKIRSERLAMVGRMAGAVTQDIAGPMEDIVTYAADLGLEDLGAEERNATCQAIEGIVDRLVELAQELLDFSRGTVELAKERYTIAELLNAVQMQVDAHGATPQARIDASAAQTEAVMVDLNKLANTLASVITISSHLARTPLDVGVGLSDGALNVRITGLPASEVTEFMRVLDDPFAGKDIEHGTGLKIAIAKRVIGAHGGTLTPQPDGVTIQFPGLQTGG